ncbi:MAG: ABC transporter substrate-binding protein [Alphaproteobacteria bacterium]|nr:ABC transporter substrate-binding protein [Alphaproteobacteria bacterium]
MRSCVALMAGTLAAFALATPALAQKQGGILKFTHRDNPPSASIHEEATISTVIPFMPVFNNLVMFDPKEKFNSPDKIVPDLAENWSWSADKTKLTFKLRSDVKWHDGKPFSANDVKCTFDALIGQGDEKVKDLIRKNPRKVWYDNLKEITVGSPTEVTFTLGRPQPSLLSMLASGYTPVYACHVDGRTLRSKPIGTGPFMVVEFKRNESIKLTRNPNYWKKGQPYLDGIEFKIVPNRSTRVLGFVAGEFDMTFDSDITFPLLKDVKDQAPHAVCEARPTNVRSNLIVNRDREPFDNPKIREALVLAIDRKPFSDILAQGNDLIGAAMLPAPAGVWGMKPEELSKLPGFGPDTAKNIAEAQSIMKSLGYGPDKTLKVKVATRNIAIYRDPAVILIDQLKKIYVDGELDPIDTTVWFTRVQQKNYQIGLNLTGAGVDDPDVMFFENFHSSSSRNYTGYSNPEVDKLIVQQSSIEDKAERMKVVAQIEEMLTRDAARPTILHGVGNTCWQPFVKGVVLQHNSIYNSWRFENIWLEK